MKNLKEALLKFWSIKVRSCLLLLCEISQAKSRHFNRNLRDWKFHASVKFSYANFTQAVQADQRKGAQLESDFGVSCALYAATRAVQC